MWVSQTDMFGAHNVSGQECEQPHYSIPVFSAFLDCYNVECQTGLKVSPGKKK